MRESAEAALSWIRAHAERLGLPQSALESQTIHLHIPAGAVPKDGPSAGVALVTSLVSMFTGRHSSGHVAMTGEISLRGQVLPVGGIKGKIFAASRAGIQTVVMPRRNEKDLVDIPADVLEKSHSAHWWTASKKRSKLLSSPNPVLGDSEPDSRPRGNTE